MTVSHERMPRRDFMAWLNDVERTLPVADWTVRGFRVWPLIRLEMYAVNCGVVIARHALAGSRWDHVRAVWNAARSWGYAVVADRAANVRPDRPADAVFLACSVGRQPVIRGKRYNPRVAPYVALLEERGKKAVVWEMSPYSVYNIPRHTPSFFIQPYLLWKRIATQVRRPAGAALALEGHADLAARLGAAGLASRYTQLAVLDRDAYFIRVLADGFIRWLESVRPSHGFIGDYGLQEDAFCLACRELGITSVDIQHGSQGELHPAYGSWAAVPPDGYELRPRVYWCWDDDSANAINRWAARCQSAHVAVVGGDAWRELWIGNDNDLVREFDAQMTEMKEAAPGTLEILVTTANLGDVLPAALLEAMAHSPASWRYWVRLHPVDQQSRLPQAVALLRQHGVKHADTIRTTQLPLHALLRHVNVHVSTSWSTVILEAEAFGVRSVACSREAGEMFADQTRTGMLRTALTAPDILSAIERQGASPRRASFDHAGRAPGTIARVLGITPLSMPAKRATLPLQESERSKETSMSGSRFTPDALCLHEYASNTSLADVHYRRAIGELPEMESSKATAKLVAERLKPGNTILDVGCGAGHYLRSFRRLISVPFQYVGVEYYSLFLDRALEAWKGERIASFRQGSVFQLPVADREFDVVVCSNLIMHLPSIVKPLGELIRASRRSVVIRTTIGDKSFRVQEVLSKAWWPYTDVEPGEEFDDDGQPRAYSFENIYSKDYFSSVVRRHAPGARITYVEDNQFAAENIEKSASTEGLVNATRVMNGKQVFGYLILPYHFVIIDLVT